MKLYEKLQQFWKTDRIKNKTKLDKLETNNKPQPTIDIKFYQNYPEKPYINPNRDLEAWLQAAQHDQSLIVPIENMKRDELGLLAGDIYLLYWLFRYRNQEFPSYFEYFFGINVNQELQFLQTKNLITADFRPTKSGCLQIDDYAIYLEQMKQYLKQNYPSEKV